MSTKCRHCKEYRDLALFSRNQLKKRVPKCWFCVHQKTVEVQRNDAEKKEGMWDGEGNKRRRIADSNALFYCGDCEEIKPAASFSNHQLDSRHSTLPRCQTCVTAAVLKKEATEKRGSDADANSQSSSGHNANSGSVLKSLPESTDATSHSNSGPPVNSSSVDDDSNAPDVRGIIAHLPFLSSSADSALHSSGNRNKGASPLASTHAATTASAHAGLQDGRYRGA